VNDPHAVAQEGEPPASERPGDGIRAQIRALLIGTFLLTLLTGVGFPLVVAALAQVLFPYQAGGSLISRNGETIGAEIIGQAFSGPGYFHPRPSAAGDGYDATASGGTNLGPASAKLRDGAPADGEQGKAFAGVRELADVYRRRNGLPPDAAVPIDAVTRSGSGLDPHISPENAALQVARVARERRLNEEAVRGLIAAHSSGPQFGFLGESRVAVLPLNLALDELAPLPALP
jgi:potassium-transporting ATPase KdpC subunit